MEQKNNKPLMESAEVLTGSRQPKKRRFSAMFFVAMVVVICIGALLAMQMSSQQPETTTAPSLSLVQYTSVKIEQIHVTLGQESYILFNDSGAGYRIEGKDSFAIESGVARRMIAQCANLNAQSIANEKAKNLAEYGLDNPAATIHIRTQNAESKTIHIGDQTPVSGFYACMDGQNTVYTLAPTVAETLMKPLRELHAVKTPSIAEPYAPAYIRIEWPQADEKRGMQVLEIQKQPRKEVGIGASNYLMTQPLIYDVDVAALAALVENIAGIKADSYAGERTTENTYGMDEAVRIVLRDSAGTEVQTEVGGHAATDARYLCFNGGTDVYLTDASTVSFLNEITLAGSIDRFISLISIDKLEYIRVTFAERSDVLRIDRTAETEVYTVNDVEVTEAVFKGFYQELCSQTANGMLTQDEKLPLPEISLTFVLKDGVEFQVEYMEYDLENYAVSRDGKACVYVHKNRIRQLLDQLYALK